MFGLLIVLLSISESLATKWFYFSMMNHAWFYSALIYMNSNELKYYPFMISLNKGFGSCNVLSPKLCVPKEIKT